MKLTWNGQHFDKRDKLDALPERTPPKLSMVRIDQPEEAYHEKTDSRDSCTGAITDGAARSNH